jgi:hypothetical protein
MRLSNESALDALSGPRIKRRIADVTSDFGAPQAPVCLRQKIGLR